MGEEDERRVTDRGPFHDQVVSWSKNAHPFMEPEDSSLHLKTKNIYQSCHYYIISQYVFHIRSTFKSCLMVAALVI
jgi:hypothetical protein